MPTSKIVAHEHRAWRLSPRTEGALGFVLWRAPPCRCQKGRSSSRVAVPPPSAHRPSASCWSCVACSLSCHPPRRRIPAHRVVLAARCEYFATMFSSGMRETRQATITIDDVSSVVFMALLVRRRCRLLISRLTPSHLLSSLAPQWLEPPSRLWSIAAPTRRACRRDGATALSPTPVPIPPRHKRPQEHLYCDTTEVEQELALPLFAAADRFGVERLKLVCAATLEANLCCADVSRRHRTLLVVLPSGRRHRRLYLALRCRTLWGARSSLDHEQTRLPPPAALPPPRLRLAHPSARRVPCLWDRRAPC